MLSMENPCASPTLLTTPLLAVDLLTAPRFPLGGRTTNGRFPRGHILSLPTELLTTIFELANDESPFLLDKGIRPDKEAPSKDHQSNRHSESDVVDEITSTLPLDRWDLPLPVAISQTCSRFRTVALAMPLLWSRITIYREPRMIGCRTEDGRGPIRWNQARLWLSRATRNSFQDGQLRTRSAGFLDIRIFGLMYTSDTWGEDMINERWFGSPDMEEICDFLLPFSPLFRSFTLQADTWEPIYTFLYRSSHLRAPNLERIELIRANTFLGKQEHFHPQNLSHPLKLFAGKADDASFTEEGCLSKLKEVILAGVHLDWSSFLSSMLLRRHGDFKSTALEALYFNYHAWNIRPSVANFLSFINASPMLETLSLVGSGPDPFTTAHFPLPGEPALPWSEILPAHPSISTLSRLRTLTLKYVEPMQGAEILVCLRALLGRTAGRLINLHTLHLGDIGGIPAWQEQEESMEQLNWELHKILPLPLHLQDADYRGKFPGGTGVKALSLTGYSDRFKGMSGALAEGGIVQGFRDLVSLEAFDLVKSLRLFGCDTMVFDAFHPRLVSNPQNPQENNVVIPMHHLSGLWLHNCKGTGLSVPGALPAWAQTHCSLVRMLDSRHRFLQMYHPLDTFPIEVVGYARRDEEFVIPESIKNIHQCGARVEFWGLEPGEVEESQDSEEEEDDRLIREAEECYDPEFEYYCDLVLGDQTRQPLEGEEGEDEDNVPLEDMMDGMEVGDESDPSPLDAPLPVPVLMNSVDEFVTSPLGDLPTPKPYQAFFNNLAHYHHIITGESMIDPLAALPYPINPTNDGRVADVDVDCGESISTDLSPTLSSPSMSSSSLFTTISTSSSEIFSVFDEPRIYEEPRDFRDPQSDDTIPADTDAQFLLDNEVPVKVGVLHRTETDFELDMY